MGAWKVTSCTFFFKWGLEKCRDKTCLMPETQSFSQANEEDKNAQFLFFFLFFFLIMLFEFILTS